MRSGTRIGVSLSTSLVWLGLAGSAFAQDMGSAPGGPAGDGPPQGPAATTSTTSDGKGTTINVTGSFGAPTQSTTTTYSPAAPAPGPDASGYLPSSSRGTTDTSRASDGFDLLQGQDSGSVMHGSKDASGVIGKPQSTVPSMHRVQRGDTLWDLCGGYFQNPWLWPKVWSYNPQIQNPHWIYPGDQVRLRVDVPPEQKDSIVLGANRGAQGVGGGGFISRRPLVARDTVFLRSMGYIDDPKKDVWGELVGSREEQMLLTQGNNVYMILRPGVDVKLGQLLTVFRPVRTPARVAGSRKPPGEIIAFRGSVKVDGWNPKTRMARGKLIESLDAVERGDKIGPVGRRFDVVPPRKNDVDLEARVLTSFYPHEIVGQHQVVIIDRGEKDGLAPGNRLFVVRRGDEWRHTLKTTTAEARTRVRIDAPEHVQTEVTPLSGKDDQFPEEVVGELRVLRADEQSSVALVTSAIREIEPGARVVGKKGY